MDEEFPDSLKEAIARELDSEPPARFWTLQEFIEHFGDDIIAAVDRTSVDDVAQDLNRFLAESFPAADDEDPPSISLRYFRQQYADFVRAKSEVVRVKSKMEASDKYSGPSEKGEASN